ncbi:hypothetical protein CSW58_09960 [Caulobacter sp. B11]|uniref:hypothetical protein n=1 Tax=Caulobacter sp. B11 TaxID=2048899 RepID=UPI000C12BE24|nr:hypothetical protein [Caulobacter sp. B11]PHY12816.1 hypothetical protein CSW58_09960 [Caulobacter sp. B11]
MPLHRRGLLTFTRDKLDAWREGHEWPVALGEYDVHIRRVSAETINNPKISDELTWVCLRAFRDQAAVRDLTGKPWIEIEMKATEQLNGVPDDFNFIATSIVAQVTAEGRGDLIASRNPADLFLAASYPPFSDIELDDDERDFVALAAWRETCDVENWTCDLVEASELAVGELMQRVAACGRARPTLDFGALSVVVDWEKPYPRQMFTPRNVQGFTGDLTYPATVHGLRVRFQNQDKDYDDDTITVFAPGYDLDTATIYESLDVRDKTDPDAVEWEGARILAERLLRPETFTFEQDVEYLTIGEGDRALLAHHVALVGQVSARVLGRVVDVEDAAHRGLRLDERVIMEPGRSYDLAWRPSADADIVTLALEPIPGQDDVVWFAAPAPDINAQPLPGDLVSVFEHAVELLDVIINRISPKAGLKAELTCVPYAPQLQAIGDAPIASYRTASSRPPGLGGAIIERRSVRGLEQAIGAVGAGVEEAGVAIEAISSGAGPIGGLLPGNCATSSRRSAGRARPAWRSGRGARIAEIFAAADLSAEAIIRQTMTSVDDRLYQEALSHLDGVPLGVVVREEQIRTDDTITSVTVMSARVTTAEAAIVIEQTTRANADTA